MLESDKKILELIDYLKSINVIRYKKEFYDVVGLKKQNVFWIKNQSKTNREHHFTAEQIGIICKKYNINANWIFGTDDRIFNSRKLSVNK